ncbi:peptide-methionine (S)-S-oxide reductase MsrA [Candidatus Gottesmanbacteria bacterium]|nr:peptide-methionine (S)-S-oxide reductase MsrA [Candidatus Gottesmanbacteria bacterium]
MISQSPFQLATLAGGCFWCTEAVFQRLKGVEKVVSGYTGGTVENPTYDQVCSGKTGHAEAIQIIFDPNIISYEKLLEVFWKLHDPTSLNKQMYDVGTEYRSAIFYHDEKQKEMAEKSKEILEQSGYYQKNIVTEIVPFTNFYPTESYNQDYYNKNRYQPYCMIIIDPKIQKLYKEFKDEVKPKVTS